MILCNTLEPYYNNPEDDFDAERHAEFITEYCDVCSDEEGSVRHADCKCGKFTPEDICGD